MGLGREWGVDMLRWASWPHGNLELLVELAVAFLGMKEAVVSAEVLLGRGEGLEWSQLSPSSSEPTSFGHLQHPTSHASSSHPPSKIKAFPQAHFALEIGGIRTTAIEENQALKTGPVPLQGVA